MLIGNHREERMAQLSYAKLKLACDLCRSLAAARRGSEKESCIIATHTSNALNGFIFRKKKIYIYIPPLIVMWIGTRSTNVLRHLWFGLGFFCSVLGTLGSASWVYLTVALKVALTTWRSSLINQIDFQPSLTTHHRQTTCSKELVQGFGLRPSQHTAIFSISIKWHLQIYIYI